MNIPNKFTFKALFGEFPIYFAEKIAEERYLVSWGNRDINQSDIYTVAEVSDFINKKAWFSTCEVSEEKKQPSFSIKEGSIESAARFIVANNNYQPYTNIQQCEESIKHYISRMIERIKRGEEAYRCSTGGWTVLIDKEDEDYYVVEVLVDPSVSQDREYVNVEALI